MFQATNLQKNGEIPSGRAIKKLNNTYDKAFDIPCVVIFSFAMHE